MRREGPRVRGKTWPAFLAAAVVVARSPSSRRAEDDPASPLRSGDERAEGRQGRRRHRRRSRRWPTAAWSTPSRATTAGSPTPRASASAPRSLAIWAARRTVSRRRATSPATRSSRRTRCTRSRSSGRRLRGAGHAAGQPVEVDPGRSLLADGRRTACRGHLGGARGRRPRRCSRWAFSCAGRAASGACGSVRASRRASPPRCSRSSIAMTLAARHDRLGLREAVVVSCQRASDRRATESRSPARPLCPEGARVEIVDSRGPSSRVRFGAVEAWVPAGVLRDLAR